MFAVAQNELGKAYHNARSRLDSYMTALDQIVAEDFPAGDEPGKVTRYHVDALNDLANRIGALVEGYEKRG